MNVGIENDATHFISGDICLTFSVHCLCCVTTARTGKMSLTITGKMPLNIKLKTSENISFGQYHFKKKTVSWSKIPSAVAGRMVARR
jgi:hypothetical protein